MDIRNVTDSMTSRSFNFKGIIPEGSIDIEEFLLENSSVPGDLWYYPSRGSYVLVESISRNNWSSWLDGSWLDWTGREDLVHSYEPNVEVKWVEINKDSNDSCSYSMEDYYYNISYWSDVRRKLLEKKKDIMKSFLDENRNTFKEKKDLLREIDSIDSDINRIGEKLEEMKGEESRRAYFG